MASKSRINGTLNLPERPSKQEPEWKPTVSANIVPGPHTRQTTESKREAFLSSSSESSPSLPLLPQARSISQNGFSSLAIVPPRSASSAISANLLSKSYDTPNANQMAQLPPQNSERGRTAAPWIKAWRKLHVPKKSMDFELMTRLGLRRQTDDTSSTSSSPQASLALLGSPASITSSYFSQSYSIASMPPAVQFPPTPVFADATPAGFMRKLEPLSVRQIPNAPALTNSYPSQNSHTIIATRSLDATHEVDSSSTPSSSPNSTPRQQPIPLPAKSVPHPSHYTPPRNTQTPTQNTPPPNIAQQPDGLTSASTGTPRTTIPLPPLPSDYPSPMISPAAQHNSPPPPNKANLKAWNQLTLINLPKGDSFEGPYRDYLATELSDNPLGLSDMKQASTEEYYKQGQPVEEQHTPWMWNSANLEDDDDDSTSPSRRNSEPESFTSQLELKPTFSPSIVRTPQHYRDSHSLTNRYTSRAFIISSPMPSMVLSTQLPDEPDMILSPLVSTHTPKPLPPLSLRRTNGVGNHHPNAILATQSLDTISEGPFAHYRISGNESTKTTTEPYHPPAQGPEPASYIYKTRHGYWNRRGDHLTPTGYLVYAPPHLAYPDDLRMYPPESEGYMDHNGLYTPWCQRPELPASLPRMGNEPELPYEKFMVWVYWA